MPRTKLTYIYFVVVNLLLFHLLLDLPREVAYRFELYRHEWYVIGVFALALLVVLAHLVAFCVSPIVYGVLRGIEAVKLGPRILQVIRPFELVTFVAFLYVNFIYLDIFVANFQASLVGPTLYSRIKMVLFLLALGLSVFFFYRYKVRIVKFLENLLPKLRWVATVTLVTALGLSAGRIAYKYEGQGCAEVPLDVLQSFGNVQADRPMPNIVVLTFDGLSAEHMSLYGYFRNTMPHLDRFSEKCTVLDNINSVSHLTLPSLITFLLGKNPTTWKQRQKAGFIHEIDNVENLLRVLEALGYSIRIALDHSFVNWKIQRIKYHCPNIVPGLGFKMTPYQFKGPWWFPRSAFSLIYGHVDYKARSWTESWVSSIKYLHDFVLGRIRRGTWKLAGRPIPVALQTPVLKERMDKDFFLPFLEHELQKTKEPAFLWIHSNVPHNPFYPPAPFFGRYHKPQSENSWEDYNQLINEAKRSSSSLEAREKLRALYDEYILYLDAGIAETFKVIGSIKLRRPLVFIITADHGANKGFLPDASKKEIYHIPLIICEPGQTDRRRVSAPGGTLDFAPTILELIGVAPPEWMEGKSLLRFMQRDR